MLVEVILNSGNPSQRACVEEVSELGGSAEGEQGDVSQVFGDRLSPAPTASLRETERQELLTRIFYS